MTNAQKYDEILKALGEAIAAKNEALTFANYQIDGLKQRLETAEKEIEELKKKKNW